MSSRMAVRRFSLDIGLADRVLREEAENREREERTRVCRKMVLGAVKRVTVLVALLLSRRVPIGDLAREILVNDAVVTRLALSDSVSGLAGIAATPGFLCFFFLRVDRWWW